PIHINGKCQAVIFIKFENGKAIGIVHVIQLVKAAQFYSYFSGDFNRFFYIEAVAVVMYRIFSSGILAVDPAVDGKRADGYLCDSRWSFVNNFRKTKLQRINGPVQRIPNFEMEMWSGRASCIS